MRQYQICWSTAHIASTSTEEEARRTHPDHVFHFSQPIERRRQIEWAQPTCCSLTSLSRLPWQYKWGRTDKFLGITDPPFTFSFQNNSLYVLLSTFSTQEATPSTPMKTSYHGNQVFTLSANIHIWRCPLGEEIDSAVSEQAKWKSDLQELAELGDDFHVVAALPS